MRLVHLVDRLDPSDGGPPAVAARLAAAQALAGHQVTIAAHRPRCGPEELAAAYARVGGYEQVRKVYFDEDSLVDRLGAAAAVRAFPAVFAGANFLHVHGVWRPLLLRAARYSVAAGVPYCVTPHGMLTEWAVSQKRVKKTLGLALGWSTVLDQAAFLHYLNDEERADARALRLTAPAVIQPNGVSMQEMAVAEAADHQFCAALPRKYILFLARLHQSKGPELLCEAFERIAARHPDVHLVFAGPDFGALARLRRDIARSQFLDRIHYLGGVYGANKLHLLRHAMCLGHATRQEGFSVTILEALMSGLPVITTRHAHFPSLATDGAGLIVENETKVIGEALDRLLSDAALRTRMGKAGQAMVREGYDWSVIGGRLASSYAQSCRGIARAAS